MLSIGRLGSSGGAEYYLDKIANNVDDYYLGIALTARRGVVGGLYPAVSDKPNATSISRPPSGRACAVTLAP